MLEIITTSKFRKDFKKIKKDKDTVEKFKKVVDFLVKEKKLPEKYKEHSLTGNYKDFRECHIKPDLLLIYKTENKNLFIVRIGAHSELFK